MNRSQQERAQQRPCKKSRVHVQVRRGVIEKLGSERKKRKNRTLPKKNLTEKKKKKKRLAGVSLGLSNRFKKGEEVYSHIFKGAGDTGPRGKKD